MEGVGARLGRSSTRYGPTTVFTGPVRKWKKNWVHVPPYSNHHHHSPPNATVNATTASSHLSLYRWTPIPPAQTKHAYHNDDDSNNYVIADSRNSNEDDGIVAEPPKKRFKYIPIAVLKEQKNESLDDDTMPIDASTNTVDAASMSDEFHEKPDINDVPIDENQAAQSFHVQRQDLNESTLDLSLGLKAHDRENESESKADQIKYN